MLRRLRVHGFRSLLDTEISFSPLTILIGKNGVGKTSILDAIQLLGNFARGGIRRAFGPPPWSLAWQRSKGFGRIASVRFEVELSTANGLDYSYHLSLNERKGDPQVEEERLTRLSDRANVASFDLKRPPPSGTVLNPSDAEPDGEEIREVSRVFRSVVSYELNPSVIELGNEPERSHPDRSYVGRDGFGVAGYLAHLKDDASRRFQLLESRLKEFRAETEAIEVWSGGEALYWGIREKNQQWAIPAVHLSWGDRQLVGLLCVLFQSSQPGTTVAVEEIDRGFHPSRYRQVVDLLSRAAYDGLDENPPLQIVVTTHSPSFLNKIEDRTSEIRVVTRVANGSTHVRGLEELLQEQFGTAKLEQPLGEAWEMGMFEDLVQGALQ